MSEFYVPERPTYWLQEGATEQEKADAYRLQMEWLHREFDAIANQFRILSPHDIRWNDNGYPGITGPLGGNDPTLAVFQDDGAGSRGIVAYKFSAGATEELFFWIQLTHQVKRGSTLRPHIHWSPDTAASGNVRWGMEYSIAAKEAAFATTTTVEIVDAADGTAKKHQKVGFGDIAGTVVDYSSMLGVRIYREGGDATDTYGGDAWLLWFDIHEERDKLGTAREYDD